MTEKKYPMYRKYSLFFVGCSLLILAACGGGGGGGGAEPSSTSTAIATFTVSGTISGHKGTVTLTNNGGDTQTVAVNATTFRFSAQNSGTNWNIAAVAPSGQTCSVSNSSGTNINTNVTNVSVLCRDISGTQTLGGRVSGLAGSLVLLNNSSSPLTIAANGSYVFPAGLSPLTTYEVTVGTQPTNQSCSIFNASGTIISIDYAPTVPSALNVSNVDVTCGPGPAYTGTVMLGAPTDTSVMIKFFSTDQNGVLNVAYGTSPGSHPTTSPATTLVAGTPVTIRLSGLLANTRYYYVVNFQPSTGGNSQTVEYSFRTAPPAGSTFTFAVQADSHLDENTDILLYRQTLQNIATDAPDFLIDLGDTFMTEKHNQALDTTPQSGSNVNTGSPPASTEQQVIARYRMDLRYFDLVTRSVPLFLANGNHDAELGWIWNGSSSGNKGLDVNLATWAANARTNYYTNPDPSTQAFFKGQVAARENLASTPSIPGRTPAAWYSWEWGDALFIVLDPYWNSSAAGGWNMSLGLDQFTWLANTLAASSARFKFVFTHNLVGGASSMRGGAEASQLFEWGGFDATLGGSGTTSSPFTITLGGLAFASRRPAVAGWTMPVHELLKAHKVTAVFHGHDHFYAQQSRDGIIYQEVPQPSARNTNNGPSTAASYGYLTGTFDSSSGHLRVTVSPAGVTSEYVRAWLPVGTSGSNNVENGGTKINRQVSQSWSCTYQLSGLCQ